MGNVPLCHFPLDSARYPGWCAFCVYSVSRRVCDYPVYDWTADNLTHVRLLPGQVRRHTQDQCPGHHLAPEFRDDIDDLFLRLSSTGPILELNQLRLGRSGG